MHLQNFIKIHKILSINEISTSIKGHNSKENERKILFKHLNLHHVDINAYTKFDWNPQIYLQDIEHNKILMLIKGHNSVKNWPKTMCVRTNMDLVYINAYTKFYHNPSIWSEDIEVKHIFTSIKGHNSVVYRRI